MEATGANVPCEKLSKRWRNRRLNLHWTSSAHHNDRSKSSLSAITVDCKEPNFSLFNRAVWRINGSLSFLLNLQSAKQYCGPLIFSNCLSFSPFIWQLIKSNYDWNRTAWNCLAEKEKRHRELCEKSQSNFQDILAASLHWFLCPHRDTSNCGHSASHKRCVHRSGHSRSDIDMLWKRVTHTNADRNECFVFSAPEQWCWPAKRPHCKLAAHNPSNHTCFAIHHKDSSCVSWSKVQWFQLGHPPITPNVGKHHHCQVPRFLLFWWWKWLDISTAHRFWKEQKQWMPVEMLTSLDVEA